MRPILIKILFLGLISFSQSNALSQSNNLSGTYKLRHDIPKEAFKDHNDSIVEFPVWLHDETIELKKNKKAKITIVNNDQSEEILIGNWVKVNETIELEIETNDKFAFVIIIIDDIPHLKLINNSFKYYKKE
ncbi:MAG: hypothetical protein RLZ33_192 [Bacteroidota bacterium]|jgi:hypothetical protein